MECGCHKVTSDGKIFSRANRGANGKNRKHCKEWRVIHGVVTSYGYKQNKIHGKIWRSHRVIAMEFIPNPDSKPQINHIDGNKLNNDISNLGWCTSAENIQHSFDTGLNFSVRRVLNPEQVKFIKDNLGKVTGKEIAHIVGTSQTTVCNINKGRCYATD